MCDARYYLGEKSLIAPKFEGKAAKLLGIEGQWDERVFLNLHDGYCSDENGNRSDKLPKYMHPSRRGAMEITFNLPKEPSILKELGGDERIGGVLTKAREAAMKEVERQYHCRSPWSQPGNLVYVAFRHASSRMNDPHSHDHVWIANLSRDTKTWKAIELRYLDRKGIANAYRDSCMKGFRQLGYKVKRVGEEYAITGVPAEVKAEFSRRHTAIAEKQAAMEAKIGKPMSSKAKGKLSVYDRPDKPPDMPLDERRKGWIARLRPDQFATIGNMVKRAKASVRMGRWREGLKRYVDRLRHSAIPEIQPERSHGIERS